MNEIYPLIMKPASEPAESTEGPPDYEELTGGTSDRDMNVACELEVSDSLTSSSDEAMAFQSSLA